MFEIRSNDSVKRLKIFSVARKAMREFVIIMFLVFTRSILLTLLIKKELLLT